MTGRLRCRATGSVPGYTVARGGPSPRSYLGFDHHGHAIRCGQTADEGHELLRRDKEVLEPAVGVEDRHHCLILRRDFGCEIRYTGRS